MQLLILDVEGTLFEPLRLHGTSFGPSIWQGLAHALGPEAEAEEMETQRRWEARDYRSYVEWMKDTIDIHIKYGLTRELFSSVIEAAEYCAGVDKALKELDRSRFEPVLISGGFRELARRAQIDLNIRHAFAVCEYIFGENDLLMAYNVLPCDFEGKLDFVHLMLREYRLTQDQWIFVGDGKNDVPIAMNAPCSVGVTPHEELAEKVTHIIDSFEELPAILDQLP